jgi:hypothetical protein
MVWGSTPSRSKIFRTCPDWPWGPLSLLYNGYKIAFQEVKWLGYGINYLLHLVLRLKKEYSYTSTPLLGLHGLFQGELLGNITKNNS